MFKHLNKEADHLEILLEDIKSKFDVVLEGYDAICKEISECKQELNEKIEMNSFLVQRLNKKIDSVEERLKGDSKNSILKELNECNVLFFHPAVYRKPNY